MIPGIEPGSTSCKVCAFTNPLLLSSPKDHFIWKGYLGISDLCMGKVYFPQHGKHYEKNSKYDYFLLSFGPSPAVLRAYSSGDIVWCSGFTPGPCTSQLLNSCLLSSSDQTAYKFPVPCFKSKERPMGNSVCQSKSKRVWRSSVGTSTACLANMGDAFKSPV